jgi:hypothetical protein
MAIPSVQAMLRNLKCCDVVTSLMHALRSPSASGTGSVLAVLRSCHAVLQAFCSCNPQNQQLVWQHLDTLISHLVSAHRTWRVFFFL